MKEKIDGDPGGESGPRRARVERHDVIWRPEEFSLHGNKVLFVGVTHEPETFRRYGRQIERVIRESSALFLEAAPLAQGYADPKVAQWWSQSLQKLDIQISPRRIMERLETAPGLHFFRSVELTARKLNKPVIIADPSINTPVGIALRGRSVEMFKAKLAAFLATSVGIGSFVLGMAGTDIARAVGGHRGPLSEEEGEKIERSNMTRRDILKKFAAVGALTGAAPLASLFADFFKFGNFPRNRVDNPLGFFLLSSQDYRDVVVAEGLSRIAKRKREIGPIALIYGDQHRGPVRYYAEHDTERRTKLLLYREMFGDISKPRLFVHHFNPRTRSYATSAEPL